MENKNLLEQLKQTILELSENFNFNKDNDSQLMSAENLKEIFLAGFARQIQLDIEQFFEFDVNIINDDINKNKIICNITAKLKNDFETNCHLLEDFLLLKNLEFTRQMFGVPEYFEEVKNMNGSATIEEENKQ